MMKFLQLGKIYDEIFANIKKKNLPRMMSIQNVYSLVNRVFDIAHSEVAIAENCGLLAYSPLAGGRLSGKYIGGKKTQKMQDTHYGPEDFLGTILQRGEIAIEKYFQLANKHGIAPSTFANAFVNNRPFVTSNIIGATM